MTIRGFSLITLLVLALASPVVAQKSEEGGVRAAIEQYFRGHATGSAAEMRKAFLPTARGRPLYFGLAPRQVP
jgi:hypothetical protein